MKPERHQWKKKKRRETIYPKRDAEINPGRCDIERIPGAPEGAIAHQGECGLSGKDARTRTRHRIVSNVRKDASPNKQQSAEDSRGYDREWRNRPHPVMHKDADEEHATNQDRRQYENRGTIRLFNHSGCCLTDRA